MIYLNDDMLELSFLNTTVDCALSVFFPPCLLFSSGEFGGDTKGLGSLPSRRQEPCFCSNGAQPT